MLHAAMKKTAAAFALATLFSLPLAAQAAVQVGSPAPEFSGKNAEGKTVSLADYKGKIVVLEWNNPECPFVRKHYGNENIQKLQKEYTDKGVVWLTINSSAKGKQGYFEGDALKAEVVKQGIHSTAYIADATGQIGHLYGAKNTPSFFIIGKDGNVAYSGAIDSIASTDPADIAKAEPYVKEALDALLVDQPVKNATTHPYGCGVKYGDMEGYDKH